MDKQMKDKTVIITGANTGIGYETALGLAKKGTYIFKTKAKLYTDSFVFEA
jgi:NAD(P)-dependent dehydrogenase (short-subunit alcohol dehydrogenase family)